MLGKSAFTALFLVGALAGTALAAAGDYDKSDNTALYTLRLRVPAAAMAITPLKTDIMARFKTAADGIKSGAADAKKDDAENFRAFTLDTNWRVTFDSPAVLSLSAETYDDEGGAHPNGAFDTIVWDKASAKPVPIDALFSDAPSALKAISDAATKTWVKTLVKRSADNGEPMSVADATPMAADGIAPDVAHLGTYALTYAKGAATANGIVLLYGAGAIWPHAIGDFRIAVPAAVFGKYLAPRWKPVFGLH